MTNGNEPINMAKEIIENANGTIQHIEHLGLTKRELFAAMAMQGLLSNDLHIQDVTGNAVNIADNLIKELNKTNV